MKRAFTLMEMLLVLVIVSLLLSITMRFGSSRIIALKAQSVKEQFVGYYNDLYSQNLLSSFRDGKKYQHLELILSSTTGTYYLLDTVATHFPQLPDFHIQNIRFTDGSSTFLDFVTLLFVPYHLGCEIANSSQTGNMVYFDFIVPQNNKQYCFEISSETCKLIETRCN